MPLWSPPTQSLAQDGDKVLGQTQVTPASLSQARVRAEALGQVAPSQFHAQGRTKALGQAQMAPSVSGCSVTPLDSVSQVGIGGGSPPPGYAGSFSPV